MDESARLQYEGDTFGHPLQDILRTSEGALRSSTGSHSAL